jgi:NADH:ubiquinone oxidoreductase subunit 2 (subunit N)
MSFIQNNILFVVAVIVIIADLIALYYYAKKIKQV